MGRSKTSKYALKMDGVTPRCWWVGKQYGFPGDGKPTNENLARVVNDYMRSLESGGVNHHVSKALGYIPYPNWAKIVINGTNTVVAEWKAPMFMAVGPKVDEWGATAEDRRMLARHGIAWGD